MMPMMRASRAAVSRAVRSIDAWSRVPYLTPLICVSKLLTEYMLFLVPTKVLLTWEKLGAAFAFLFRGESLPETFQVRSTNTACQCLLLTCSLNVHLDWSAGFPLLGRGPP